MLSCPRGRDDLIRMETGGGSNDDRIDIGFTEHVIERRVPGGGMLLRQCASCIFPRLGDSDEMHIPEAGEGCRVETADYPGPGEAYPEVPAHCWMNLPY
jgi:hypothetical protein